MKKNGAQKFFCLPLECVCLEKHICVCVLSDVCMFVYVYNVFIYALQLFEH